MPTGRTGDSDEASLTTKVKPPRTVSALFENGYDLESERSHTRSARVPEGVAVAAFPFRIPCPHGLAQAESIRLAGAERYLKKVRAKRDFHHYLAGMAALFRGDHDAAQRALSAVRRSGRHSIREPSAQLRAAASNKGDMDSAASVIGRVSSMDRGNWQ